MKKLSQAVSTKSGAMKLSMIVVIALISLKLIVSSISNSISISAQAADSFLDVFSIGVTFVALQMASAPADEKHPFGHGKAEGLAAMTQAMLVVGAGVVIIYSAIQRILSTAPIEADEGIAVMLVSIVASFFLSRHLRRVAKATGSTAMDASARNIGADVYSASGVLLGLAIVRVTGLVILDPVIALIMAGFVLKAGYEVTMRAIRELVDSALPREEQQTLVATLQAHRSQLVDFHAIRSRSSGSERFVDLHVVAPRWYTVEQAHAVSNHLERDIKDNIQNANVMIHTEPCNDADCPRCAMTGCHLRKAAYIGA